MFQNRQELTEIIKEIREDKGLSILEAIIHICEKYSVEEETIAAYIRQSHKLKEELRIEAEDLRMLK